MSRSDVHALGALSLPGWYEKHVLPRITKTTEGCWIWTGAKACGYGMIHIPCVIVSGNIHVGVHRVVWMRERGPIPQGLVIDHDGPNGCHNRACCNPEDLQTVTQRHNIMVTGHGVVAENGRKTHCPKGHPLAGKNLLPAQIARGSRDCAACKSDRYALRMEAARLLGMSGTAYVATYGYTTAAAQRVIAESMRAA
ncbi:MAG TPA: HNH endonuclease signature motif containing protein [Propionibacteriaceae bacterium]